jgi:flagellum-specific peptidoglycan hydrolase FlgJ
VADVGTTLAVEAYQAVMLNMNPPSGRVEPASATYYSLAARPLVDDVPKTVAGHYGELPPEVISAATASRVRWNVPVSITLAQWVVESAWGAAIPPGSNNPFGIKAAEDQPAVESPTREVIGGDAVTVTARFRKFVSLDDAFDQHGRLLATAAVYRTAMAQVKDPDAFADALTGVYATDPQYGFMLKWVIHNYGFVRYDR